MPLTIGEQMPSLEGAGDWLNRYPEKDATKGFPILIQFWAISCPVCKINLPALRGFVEAYQASDLKLISIHMPRMEEDTDIKGVKAVVGELGLTGPCAIDNQYVLGDRFQTGGSWPYYFLFDADGKLRSWAAGLTGIKMAENSLKRLLGLGEHK